MAFNGSAVCDCLMAKRRKLQQKSVNACHSATNGSDCHSVSVSERLPFNAITPAP